MHSLHLQGTLLTNEQAAFYIGVSPGQLRISRHTGEIFKGIPTPSFIKLSRAVRYKRNALDEWIGGLTEYRSSAHHRASHQVTQEVV